MKERRCIVLGETTSAEELIRFVCDPTGVAVPDLAEKLPGRGCWVTASEAAITKACEKNLFKRHIDATAPDAAEVITQLQQLLTGRVSQTLALARRAGLAIGGGGKLATLPYVEGMLIAGDASRRESKAHQNRLQPEWVFEGFDSAFLGHPFGRDSLAYIGILLDERRADGGLTGRLFHELARFQAFMGGITCHEGPGGCITPNQIDE